MQSERGRGRGRGRGERGGRGGKSEKGGKSERDGGGGRGGRGGRGRRDGRGGTGGSIINERKPNTRGTKNKEIHEEVPELEIDSSKRKKYSKEQSNKNEISTNDEPIRVPLEPIKNIYQDNSANTNQGPSSNLGQTSTLANTSIQTQFMIDDQFPTFNSEPTPTSLYFNEIDKMHKPGPFTLYIDPDIERGEVDKLSVQQQYSEDTPADSYEYDLENYNLKNYEPYSHSYNQQRSTSQFTYQSHDLENLSCKGVQRSTSQFQKEDIYQSQATLPTSNSYTMNTQKFRANSQKLFFSDEDSLVNWLRTRPDLIIKAQNFSPYKVETTNIPMDKEIVTNLVMEQCKLLFLRTRNPTKKTRETLIMKIVPTIDPISKEFKVLYRKTREYFDNFRHTFNRDMAALAKDLLVKASNPSNESIKQFVAGKVWKQKLSKYLDASDYTEFKKFPSSLKSLEIFVAESLKIHVEYLIAIQSQKKLSYCEYVLSKIKKLDQLTIQLSIPSASRRNYVNELNIDQLDVNTSSEDNYD